MNTVSSIASPTAAYVPATSPQTGTDARAASTPAAAGPETQISPQARGMKDFS
jgi:hypothetical protein